MTKSVLLLIDKFGKEKLEVMEHNEQLYPL